MKTNGIDAVPLENTPSSEVPGGIWKQVIYAGVGEKPSLGSTVRVHYNAYFELNDEPYDSTVRCRSLISERVNAHLSSSIFDVVRVNFNWVNSTFCRAWISPFERCNGVNEPNSSSAVICCTVSKVVHRVFHRKHGLCSSSKWSPGSIVLWWINFVNWRHEVKIWRKISVNVFRSFKHSVIWAM